MANITFGPSAGTWGTGADWVGGTKPGAGDGAIFASTSGNCTMDDGTASAASDPLGTSPIEFIGGHDELDKLEFWAASNTSMTVIQEG